MSSLVSNEGCVRFGVRRCSNTPFRTQMPAQLAAILHSRRLQHVLTCAPDPSAIRRLGHWILCRLSEGVLALMHRRLLLSWIRLAF